MGRTVHTLETVIALAHARPLEVLRTLGIASPTATIHLLDGPVNAEEAVDMLATLAGLGQHDSAQVILDALRAQTRGMGSVAQGRGAGGLWRSGQGRQANVPR